MLCNAKADRFSAALAVLLAASGLPRAAAQRNPAFPPATTGTRQLATTVAPVSQGAGMHALRDSAVIAERKNVRPTPSPEGERQGFVPEEGKAGLLCTTGLMFLAGRSSRLVLDVQAKG